MDKTGGARVVWLDTARGIGIFLVVFGHVLRSLVASHVLAPGGAAQSVDRLIYAFHIPLFFLISGLLARPIPPRAAAGFLKGRAQALLYPYLLWSLIQGGLSLASPGSANHPITLHDLLSIGWRPIAQFWFLYALFLCQLLLLLPGRAIIVAAGLGLALAVPWLHAPLIIRITAGSLPFFAAGVGLTLPRADRLLGRPAARVAAAALCWAGFAISLVAVGRWPGAWPYPIAWLPGLFGALGTLALSRLIGSRPNPLALLGQTSMVIFLTHVIAAAVVRVILLRIAPGIPVPALLLLLTAVGIGIPLGIARAAHRLGLERWLGFARTAHGKPRLVSTVTLDPEGSGAPRWPHSR